MKLLKKKLNNYFLNNEKKVIDIINNTIMLTVSIVQTILVIVIGLYVGIAPFEIIVTILTLIYMIRKMYTINHYSIINCTLFTIMALVLGMFAKWYSVIVFYLILEYWNKATFKLRSHVQEKGHDPLFFNRSDMLGVSVVGKLIKWTSNR